MNSVAIVAVALRQANFGSKEFGNSKKRATFVCSYVRFVAQLVEHVTLNHGVEGSSPSEPTEKGGLSNEVAFFREKERSHARSNLVLSYDLYSRRSVTVTSLSFFVSSEKTERTCALGSNFFSSMM